MIQIIAEHHHRTSKLRGLSSCAPHLTRLLPFVGFEFPLFSPDAAIDGARPEAASHVTYNPANLFSRNGKATPRVSVEAGLTSELCAHGTLCPDPP